MNKSIEPRLCLKTSQNIDTAALKIYLTVGPIPLFISSYQEAPFCLPRSNPIYNTVELTPN